MPAKDAWDKIDIVGKLLSGVVVAAVAVLVKTGADEFATSLHQGELVRNLITDLTTNGQQSRQDVALIALNRTIGDDKPDLVAEIAGRLVVDSLGYTASDRGSDQTLRSVAFQIVQRRRPQLADSLRAVLFKRFEISVSRDTSTRAASRSSPDTSRHAEELTTRFDSVQRMAAEVIGGVDARVVFIQFQGGIKREVMDSLRARFSALGFAAPRAERVASPFSNSVRYFDGHDHAIADSVGRIARAFLARSRSGVPDIPLVALESARRAPRQGQVELWLSIP